MWAIISSPYQGAELIPGWELPACGHPRQGSTFLIKFLPSNPLSYRESLLHIT